jgi:hypothetical protein
MAEIALADALACFGNRACFPPRGISGFHWAVCLGVEPVRFAIVEASIWDLRASPSVDISVFMIRTI